MTCVTQDGIAKKIGVSQQAVAFALSSRPDFRGKLRPETRKRILETAQQMGYVPHLGARRMARARSVGQATSFDQVGLIYLDGKDDDLDQACLAIMRGAEHDLSNLQASLTFVRVGNRGDWAKVDRLTRSGGVDGWLLLGTVNDEVVDRLKPGELPFVVLGDHRCTQPVHSVNVDHVAAGRLVAQHLASLGHRRIAFLHGSMKFVYQQQMLEGYRAAVKELGLDDDERLIANATVWRDPMAGPITEWVKSTNPTALFTSEFGWAYGVCRILQQSQVEVPKDISLLAYEPASPASKELNFARIDVPLAELGRQGAFLIHKLALEPGVEPNEISISPSLIEGWSTCSASHPSRTGKESNRS